MVEISLIVPTINRTKELELFLDSLTNQIFKKFELIIIDQNKDDSIKQIIENYNEKLEIIYLKSLKKGLSYNRNIGLTYAKGNIIGFPDDDCEYLSNTLKKVEEFFRKNKNYNIYSCGVQDKNTNAKFKFLKYDKEISIYNLMKTGCSITFFINKKDKFDQKFDENLGVGSFFGSGEETDFISSLLKKGYKGFYFAEDYIYHDVKQVSPTYDRYYKYGLGYGALYYKEIRFRKNYIWNYFVICKILKCIIGILFLPKLRIYQKAYLKGLINGVLGYRREKNVYFNNNAIL